MDVPLIERAKDAGKNIVGRVRGSSETQQAPMYTVKPLSGYTNEWSTTMCQCSTNKRDEDIPHEWLMALLCLPCASSVSRLQTDQTPHSIIVNPVLNYNIVRHRYNIRGDDAEDAIRATCCMPCAVRQALTESRIRGHVPQQGQIAWGEGTGESWNKDLFSDIGPLFCFEACCCMCMNARTRENFDGSSCMFNFLCADPCSINRMIRHAYSIPGDAVGDCGSTICCMPCSIKRANSEVTARFAKDTFHRGAQKIRSGLC